MGCRDKVALRNGPAAPTHVVAVLLSVALVLVALVPGGARAACGDFYRIRAGDTLQSIAVRRLRHQDFRAIFLANRDILRDPARIEVGQLVYLPCAANPKTRRAALAEAGVRPTRRDDLGDRQALAEGAIVTGEIPATASAHRAVPGAGLRVLTGSGLAPLVDRGLPSDGMALVLVAEALAAASDPRSLEPAFVDDWKSHLTVLMPTGAFPLALPWPRPDCGGAGLSPGARKMCDDFLFSEPFYEIPVAVLVPVDSPLTEARAMSALDGRTICRPEGFPPVDLETLAAGLRVVGAPDARDCARLVARGDADAVSLPEPAARRLLDRPEAGGGLVRARYLGTSVPVHAVAWRGDPGAAALIAELDRGLREMQASGRWMKIIAAYLRGIDRLPVSQ